MLYRAVHGVLRPLTHAAYRPTITGTDNVPRCGGVLLASNHLSFIDSFVIPLAAPRRVAFLAKSDYFTGEGVRGTMLRELMEGMGAVPVDRLSPSAAQDSLESALDVLNAGEAFGIYPEGTRSRDGRLYRGRTGVAWLALKAQVPVVPVGLLGTAKIQPIGSRLPTLAKVTVRFGTPITPAAYADLPQGRARRQLTDDVMDAIAGLSGQDRVEGYNELPGASEGEALGI
ncbi:MAG: lysophospholipid acyltransferase family protein [Nostocoides sp.]